MLTVATFGTFHFLTKLRIRRHGVVDDPISERIRHSEPR